MFNTTYTDDDYRNDCIRGLCIHTVSFSDYINKFREAYREFYKEKEESILSHSLEFKYFKGGEGVAQPIKDIEYDLNKLIKIGKKNSKINFPFSKNCTLLVFIGKRGSSGIIKTIDEKMKEWHKTFDLLECKKFHSNNEERHVIRFDFKK